MSSVKRYYVFFELDYEEHKDGDWVKWEDHEKCLEDIRLSLINTVGFPEAFVNPVFNPKEQHGNPQKEASNKEDSQDTQEDSTGH